MNAKQYWEAAQKTCVTMGDMVVDPQTAAQLRRVQAGLRGQPQPRKAKEAYDLASLARDALTHGDKEDAQRLITQLQTLLDPAAQPTAAKSPANRADPIPAEAETEIPRPQSDKKPEKADQTPEPARKSATRRLLMPIFNKLRTAFGGERGPAFIQAPVPAR